MRCVEVVSGRVRVRVTLPATFTDEAVPSFVVLGVEELASAGGAKWDAWNCSSKMLIV